MKLLVAINYWEGDRAQAEETIRLLADFEPAHSQDVGLCIAYRRDALLNPDCVKYASRKFDVMTFRGRRREIGWPAGCNATWYDLMTHFAEQRAVGKLGEYEAVLTLESDCVPLTLDWSRQLIRAWRARPKGVVCMGHKFCYEPGNPWTEHINGVCLLSLDKDFLAFVRRKGGCSPTIGWDAEIATEMRGLGWMDTPLIRYVHKIRSASSEWLDQVLRGGCALLHGVKDFSAHRWTRRVNLSPRVA